MLIAYKSGGWYYSLCRLCIDSPLFEIRDLFALTCQSIRLQNSGLQTVSFRFHRSALIIENRRKIGNEQFLLEIISRGREVVIIIVAISREIGFKLCQSTNDLASSIVLFLSFEVIGGISQMWKIILTGRQSPRRLNYGRLIEACSLQLRDWSYGSENERVN